MIRRHLGGVALAVVVAGARLLAQQPASPPQPTGTGIIAGVVTVAGSGDPARAAQVRLVSLTPRLTRTATTDDDGRFVIDRLPAADYTLSALKPTFLEMVYGARKPGANMPGAVIKLAAAQKIETIALALPRGGAINGRILDEFGDPVYQARVTALRFAFKNGERTLTQSGVAVSDDRGQFRLPSLMPGDYLISAVPEQSVAMATAAGISERARMLEIAAQLRRTGDTARAEEVERGVQDLEAAAAVAAKAKGYAAGAPALEQTVIVFPEDRALWLPSSRRIQLVRPGADGKYWVRNLPPGDYRVAAVLDPEGGIQFDRDFLARLVPLAAPVRVGEGERRTQDLTVR